MGAGKYNRRVIFQSAAAGSDRFGNKTTGAWVDKFTVYAEIVPKFGSEQIMAGKLAGRTPFNITVRYSSDTVQVTEAWRVVDDLGIVYNIRSIVNLDGRFRDLEMLCEKGVAT